MRKLKFRAWDETESIMRFYANIWNNSQPSRHVSTGPNRMGNILNRIHLMQYTGLKDKNGKEIYEGDILAFSYGIPGRYVKGGVEYINGAFFMHTKKNTPDKCLIGKLKEYIGEFEIIGNIYENPELLEES